MAQAEYKAVVGVEREKFFKAITAYHEYPKIVDGCKSVSVETKGPGAARVTYKMNIVREVSYTLDHIEKPNHGGIEWKLVSSDLIKKNIGSWTLKDAGPGKTEVVYNVDIEFAVPVPSFVLGPLVKTSIPTMIKGFEKQAKTY